MALLKWSMFLAIVHALRRFRGTHSFAPFATLSHLHRFPVRSKRQLLISPINTFSDFSHRTMNVEGSAAKAANDEFDEFGDDGWAANLDLDQIVSNHQQQQYPTTTTDTQDAQFAPKPSDMEVVNLENDKKRASMDSKNSLKRTKVSDPQVLSSFQNTLKHYFGYSEFREGQLQVIEAVAVEQRDAAVYWATGQGKSLCYQIPALFADQKQVVIVVSPLVSLMQDQVYKLNALEPNQRLLAQFLGSAQLDPSVEARALEGEFSLLYVTPEKLLSGSFLQRLQHMHTSIKPIALFAIDEAHCVSEWGHDFRPEFREIGQALRGDENSLLSKVPILALTATAVPRVQDDIVKSLSLQQNYFKALQSFDRSNLSIGVSKKPSGGMAKSLRPLVAKLQNPNVRPSQQSTIVYAPTRSAVEEAANFLQANLGDKNNGIVVEAYHAGMSNQVRQDVHTNFLTGRSQVIVSTVAFGMGIDKPDIRRVFHLGAPKTLEEYYQQIGRAGRDGLPAECQMVCTESDFDRYQDDFYLGKLKGKALEATKESMNALRSFALDAESCRRKTLLDYFEQTAPFGKSCGNCDNCKKVARYADDAKRDFGELGARVILQAVASTKAQSRTNIFKVLNGKLLDDWRYNGDKNLVKEQIDQMRKKIPSIYCKDDYFGELLSSLVTKELVAESEQTSQGQYSRKWTVYNLTRLGREVLQNSSEPIFLTVPLFVREAEQKAEASKRELLGQLEANGIKASVLPAEELEKGDGEVVRAYSTWFSYLKRQRSNGRVEREEQLKKLLTSLEDWRSMVAFKHRLPPGTVLPDHQMVALAYTQATLPPGKTADLSDSGVKSREMHVLENALSAWVNEYQPAVQAAVQSKGNGEILFPSGGIQAEKKWEFAVYKPMKKTGVPRWEESYIRFVARESPQSIAMNQNGGRKPVQVMTVVGHLLEALVQGKILDVTRITELLPTPNEDEWRKLEESEITAGMNILGDPDSSGRNGEKFLMADFVRPIVGDLIASKSFNERSDEERHLLNFWFDKLKWYTALRRINYEPTFGSSSEK